MSIGRMIPILDPRILQCECGGFITIKIDYENNLAFFKLDHTLHSHPNHIDITDNIKQYINANIRLSVSEIYREIKEQQLPGRTPENTYIGHILILAN
jgi:hypothetical protein